MKCKILQGLILQTSYNKAHLSLIFIKDKHYLYYTCN